MRRVVLVGLVVLAVAARPASAEAPVVNAQPKTVIEPRPSSRRTIGVTAVLGGAGLALGALGLAVYAKRDYDAQFDDPDGAGPARARCGSFEIAGKPACDRTGQERTDRARKFGTIATVAGVVGVVAAATGVVLWVTSPKKHRERAVAVVPSGAGLLVSGRF